MSINFPYMGEGYAPAYQISPVPWVTSSTIALGAITEIQFGNVTKYFTIKNNSPSTVLAIAFTQNGLTPANSYFYPLSGSSVQEFEIRTDRIFLSGSAGASISYTVLAGLTSILPTRFLTVTASNGYQNVG